MSKSAEAFRTIGEVAEELDVPKHVLRFWEGKFPQIRPMKRGGGRRYYRPEDTELLRGIRHLLHAEGYTIKGVQKILREQGIDEVKSIVREAMAARASSTSKRKSRKPSVPHGEVAKASPSSAAPAHAQQSPSATAIKPQPASVQTAQSGNQREVIAAAIRELQACRGILTGMAQGKPAETARRASAART
jgi:DNA-binding transcriptional MerR regulator